MSIATWIGGDGLFSNERSWHLRPAAAGDDAAIAALIVRAFARQPVMVDPPPSALRVTAPDVAAGLAAGGGLVVEAAGMVVGALLWSRQADALQLARVSVDPAWRRRGIATGLLAAAAEVARARGLARMTLGTRLALVGNRALFAAAGFREVSLESHPGYAAPTWVVMERRL